VTPDEGMDELERIRRHLENERRRMRQAEHRHNMAVLDARLRGEVEALQLLVESFAATYVHVDPSNPLRGWILA
jgi:hypothetical protein